GANGAGKTTLLSCAAGTLKAQSGRIRVNGRDVTSDSPSQRARAGLCLIPEGRGVFHALTVRENLRMQVPPWAADASGVDSALEAFPVLKRKLGQLAGTMSGGEQQMLALCRAWIGQAAVVMVDEVSMGLAPHIVDEIFVALRELRASGVALVIVEQYV